MGAIFCGLIQLDSAAPFAGRYRVVRRIAAGGMGAVFEVVHIETQRRRALKVMLPELVSNQELRDRFQMEARVTAHVDSEYIVDVFDAGIDAATGMPFLVMELLRGEELGEILRRSGAIAALQAVVYLRQVASALDKTHAAGIVHRDLKPENLFLTRREDGTARIKILDFGISKVVSDATTGANVTRSLGTPLYMAPEQVLGQHVSPATDLYSLGLMAYTLLVGVSYWQTDAEQFENPIAFALHTTKGASESPIARAALLGRWLPAGFDAWFERATHLTPARRFQKASELVSALAALFGDTGGAWAPTPPSALSPALVHTGAPAISAAMAIGTGPGTEFDRVGTSPGVPRPATNARWLISAALLGVLVLAAFSVFRWHSSTPAAALPASATVPSVAIATPSARAVPLVAPLAASDSMIPPAPPSASASARDPILQPAVRARPSATAPSIANKASPAHPALGPKYTRD